MQLFVFSVQPTYVHAVVRAGATGIVVDWERRGKVVRQRGHDTQINADSPEDLRRVRAATDGRVLCRINGYGPWTAGEVATAVAGGADEVLLPMVRRADEVEQTLELARGQCSVGILIETQDAVDRAEAFGALPLSRIYVGLNDLRIDRGCDELFEPLIDGTVAQVRSAVQPLPFGVAGLTRPDAGHPVPSRLLAGELARLDAQFTFLRRSFLADTAGRDLDVEVTRILASVAAARARTAVEVEADHAELLAAVTARPLLSA